MLSYALASSSSEDKDFRGYIRLGHRRIDQDYSLLLLERLIQYSSNINHDVRSEGIELPNFKVYVPIARTQSGFSSQVTTTRLGRIMEATRALVDITEHPKAVAAISFDRHILVLPNKQEVTLAVMRHKKKFEG
ncbi:hypothetical protein GJ496_005695 [Pomphorhynchus laevis]|nr:hypothetical protein GJ496_005695 [Pomphorhynchus laevis]